MDFKCLKHKANTAALLKKKHGFFSYNNRLGIQKNDILESLKENYFESGILCLMDRSLKN